MNRKELVSQVAGKLDLHLNHVDTMLTTTLDVIKETIKSGDDVSLIGFGTFTNLDRKERAGVNPSTGEKITIKATKVPKFRPGKAFKELLNN